MANQTAGSRGAGVSRAGGGGGGGSLRGASTAAARGAASPALLARSAFSSTSLSIARVLSVSVSRRGADARAMGPAGLPPDCEPRMGPASGLPPDCEDEVTALPPDWDGRSAGSTMRICTPHRLQRTMSRLPRIFSSAICRLALQLSQMNCIPGELYNRSTDRPSRFQDEDAALPEASLPVFLRGAPRRPRLRGCSVPAFCALYRAR